jgi:parallel beta-helix repeat protein
MTSGPLYVTVRGLVFRNYASLAAGTAAVRGITGWRIEDCLFDSPGRTGLDLRGDDIALTQTTIQYAFQHAFVAYGPANGSTGPTDPAFSGIVNLQVRDVILWRNFSPNMPTQLASSASAVAKILGSKNVLIDNIESSENNGPGLWFDANNFGYIVRDSYFHDNQYLGDGYSPGRGLHLEISWSPGLVDHNVFANNAHEGVAVSNSSGVTIRNNLFYGNLRQIVLSNWDRGTSYPLEDVLIESNHFKDWREHGCIEVLGDITADNVGALNLLADANVYEPVRSNWLSGWWGSTLGAITTISGLRTHLGWEQNGSIGVIRWPQTGLKGRRLSGSNEAALRPGR